jgi:hypothetical protein
MPRAAANAPLRETLLQGDAADATVIEELPPTSRRWATADGGRDDAAHTAAQGDIRSTPS